MNSRFLLLIPVTLVSIAIAALIAADSASAFTSEIYWRSDPAVPVDSWEFRFSTDGITWQPASINAPPEADLDARMAEVVVPAVGWVRLRSVLQGVPSLWGFKYAALPPSTVVHWHQNFPPGGQSLDGWDFEFSDDWDTFQPTLIVGFVDPSPDALKVTVMHPDDGWIEIRAVNGGVGGEWAGSTYVVPEPPMTLSLLVGIVAVWSIWKFSLRREKKRLDL